jgi:hypothetical protein
MRTYYVIFNEDETVTTSFEPVIDHAEHEFIKTRVSDLGNLEYYAHKSRAEFYRKALVDGVLV